MFPLFNLCNRRRTLKYDVAQAKAKLSAKQAADLQEKRNALSTRILQWRGVQMAYTPAIAPLLLQRSSAVALGSVSTAEDELAENIPLFLPSSVPINTRDAMKNISIKELRLRKAQAEEALDDVRRGRRMITGLSQFKRLNINGAGNKPNTKMRTLYNRLQRQIQRAANRYRTARDAVQQLDAGATWCKQFRKLEQADIRGPGKQSDDPLNTPNGRHEQSWIWSAGRPTVMDDTEEEFDEIMRAEWAKMRARRDRWEEEYRLVVEEMRRTVAYLEWKAAWWHGQCWRRKDVDVVTQLGLRAYAERQVWMMKLLAESCIVKWVPTLLDAGVLVDWAVKYMPAIQTGQILSKAVDTKLEVEMEELEEVIFDDEEAEDKEVDDIFDSYDFED
jgi:hypothetical protein